MFTPAIMLGTVIVHSFIISRESASNLSEYTFSTTDIGDAESSRRVHVVIHAAAGAAQTVTGVTIRGVAATINMQTSSNVAADFVNIAIVTAVVPTGASGDIVVTWSGAMTNTAIGVYRSTGLSGQAALDTDNSTADPATATLTSSPGGFCLGGVTQKDGTTVDWTVATEDYDDTVETTLYSGGSVTTSGSTIAPSADYAAATTPRVGGFATFGI